MSKWKRISLSLITGFVLFDLVLHIGQCFGIYLYRFPTMVIYNNFWTIGWGVVLILLLLVVLKDKGRIEGGKRSG